MTELQEIPAEIAVHNPVLIPQAHGGALLSGGVSGHKGGTGRPKEALRAKMRALLDSTLDAMSRALANERLAHDAAQRLLNDGRIARLSPEVRAIIAAACSDNLSGALTPREIGIFHETLARYGVGSQQEVEQTKSETRYVIRLPARPSAAGHRSSAALLPSART